MKNSVHVWIEIVSDAGIIRHIEVLSVTIKDNDEEMSVRERILEAFLINKPLNQQTLDMGADAFSQILWERTKIEADKIRGRTEFLKAASQYLL